MAGATTHFALPYPTGGDQPCQGADQITNLSDAIFNQLDTFNDIITMQKPGDLPMASVAYIGDPIVWPADNYFAVIFNTVEQDDIRAADLITKNNALTLGITPDLYGTYLYGFTTICDTSAGWQIRLLSDFAANALLLPAFDGWDNPTSGEWVDATQPPCFAASALLRVNAANAPVTVQSMTGIGQLSGSSSYVNMTLRFSRLWAVRLGGI